MKNRIILPSHITGFTRALREEERAPATIEKYLRDIQAFTAWLDGRAVTKELLSGWKEYLLTQHLSPSTINSKISAINSLLRFLGWNDCRVKFLKLQRRAFRDASRDLTRSDFEKLKAAASEQLALLLETICATGIRVSG